MCCTVQGMKHRTKFYDSVLFDLMLNLKPKCTWLGNFVYQRPLMFNCPPWRSQIPHPCHQSFSFYLQYSRPWLKTPLHLFSLLPTHPVFQIHFEHFFTLSEYTFFYCYYKKIKYTLPWSSWRNIQKTLLYISTLKIGIVSSWSIGCTILIIFCLLGFRM